MAKKDSMSIMNEFKNAPEKEKIESKKILKVGIIGTGWIADAHAAKYKEMNDVEIVALADLVPGKAEKFAEKYRRNVKGLSAEAIGLLKVHIWSGNIRELQNCIEKAVILSDSEKLTAADMKITQPLNASSADKEMSGTDTLEETEEKAIRAAMARFGGNLSMVAKSLNISRPTLYAKLKKYNI